ncbi:hypothetical protein LTR37_010699 [Vermiconidia calcicola]|uniref:Uncharacterized protein n=1 Tax=Vermiconidia calcicola TaxID=1690605 RepID=A0ACC3N592_9PEZI|nr:hypothetical protein LTR37_010699 [Vermiconidia calcicola]
MSAPVLSREQGAPVKANRVLASNVTDYAPAITAKSPVHNVYQVLKYRGSGVHNVEFEPLHTPVIDKTSPRDGGGGSVPSGNGDPSGLGAIEDLAKRNGKSETVYEAKNIWHAMNQKTPNAGDNLDDETDDEDADSPLSKDVVREAVITKAWDSVGENHDYLLFGPPKTDLSLSAMHPGPPQVLKLWQIFMENVNPLLKLVHAPTLQTRIIDAVGNMTSIDRTLEALMFSIYCVTVVSLDDDDCGTLFSSPRAELLASYRPACQQALANATVLRSNERECLTALFLYLVSVRPDTQPRSLSPILGVAIRIAQRMGIHNEATYSKCTALEAEMRRRLWWSLVIIDNRICEMSHHMTTLLDPTWDCRIPLNVNDSDFREEMTAPPAIHERPTEALFAVVRAELAEFVRHSDFHLDFSTPCLKPIAQRRRTDLGSKGEGLAALERHMEEKYLQFCNAENPLHYLTIWWTRGYIAKFHILEHYAQFSIPNAPQTDKHFDATLSHALRMLECDTKLTTSPLGRGYSWLIQFHFPFLGFLYIVQDMKKRPDSQRAETCWRVMGENYETRFMHVEQWHSPLYKLFSNVILQAWAAHELAFGGATVDLPRMVEDIRYRQNLLNDGAATNANPGGGVADMNLDDFMMPMSIDFSGAGLHYGLGGQASLDPWPSMSGLQPEANQLNWAAPDWYGTYIQR